MQCRDAKFAITDRVPAHYIPEPNDSIDVSVYDSKHYIYYDDRLLDPCLDEWDFIFYLVLMTTLGSGKTLKGL